MNIWVAIRDCLITVAFCVHLSSLFFHIAHASTFPDVASRNVEQRLKVNGNETCMAFPFLISMCGSV